MSFGETLHRPALRTSERDRRCSQRANLQMSSILGIVLISVCALFIPNSSKRRLGYSPEPVVEGASRWSSERRTLPEHMLQRRGHKGFRPIFDSFTSAVGGGISGRPAYESTRDATRTGKAFAKAGGASGDAVSNKSTSRTTRGRPGDESQVIRPPGQPPRPPWLVGNEKDRTREQQDTMRKATDVIELESSASRSAKRQRRERSDVKVEAQNLAKVNSKESVDAKSGSESLRWYLGDLTFEHFMGEYFEKKPLLVRARKGDAERAKQLFDYQTLLKVIDDNELFYQDSMTICSFKDGRKQVADIEGRASSKEVDHLYTQKGNTVQLYRPQRFSNSIWKFNHELENDFGDLVGASVYLTPANSQGLAPHHDDVEVFIVQTEGEKRWRVFEPLKDETLPRHHSQDLDLKSVEEKNKCVLECTLKPGDRLYLPRGFIHYATTVGKGERNVSSCHVTISTYQQHSMADLLLNIFPAVMKKAFIVDEDYRKGLPTRYARTIGSASILHERARLAVENGIRGEDFEEKTKLTNGLSIDGAKLISHIRQLFLKAARYLDQRTVAEICDEMNLDFMRNRLPPCNIEKESNELKGLSPGSSSVEFRIVSPECLSLIMHPNSVKLFHSVNNKRETHMGLPVEEMPGEGVDDDADEDEEYYTDEDEEEGEDQRKDVADVKETEEKKLLPAEELKIPPSEASNIVTKMSQEATEAHDAILQADKKSEIDREENAEAPIRRYLSFQKNMGLALALILQAHPRYLTVEKLERRYRHAGGEAVEDIKPMLNGLFLEGLIETRKMESLENR
eukprot:CAMPEP_0167741934 /NCGR_PEP_ID=MMETSP0110_2-20121227/1136_1 /TAXON_ID=629695 /ORGANISM="Gymnochlora sp., Strain CCMP2014" /LENGTH=795 /DNA_ID=CAMNT_0007626049 /DNA_START=1671 /DNA_END=4058 /DNA_ORIENTATION=-